MTYLRVKASKMNLISSKEPIARLKLSHSTSRSLIWFALILTKKGWILQLIDKGFESNDYGKMIPFITECALEQIDNHIAQ